MSLDVVLAAVAGAALLLLAGVGLLFLLGRDATRRRALLDSSLDLITVVDADGRIRYQSAAIGQVLGHAHKGLTGMPIAHLLHPDDPPRLRDCLSRAQQGDGPADPVVLRWRHADGSVRWLETICTDLLRDRKVAGIVLNSRDVSERHRLSEQLRQRAFRDPLTGLANRSRLEERLEQTLDRDDAAPAILFIDVDNFKTVNDTLGHAAGDQFLEEVAERLRACVRTGDVVARMGGDEFVVLLTGLSANVRGPRIAERILRELAAPLELRGRTITPTASIGIANGNATQRAHEILHDADMALYAAKRRGKGQIELYRPFMRAAALDQQDLEEDLRLALERDELVLHYQPLFRMGDGELAGYEALVRWQHPSRGLLAPDSFIALAEQTGLIVPLTRWVLHAACQQAAAWQANAPDPLDVAVNLSFINLKDETIIDDVSAALKAASITPEELVLEITESTVVREEHASHHVLSELKKLGVRLALDDFGTGLSSLSRLGQLPFDSLKIPQPFIKGIGYSDTYFALTHGIVELGHRLDLSVVAEGIETATQLARVRAIGCELGQGFHLAVPGSSERRNPAEDRTVRDTIAPAPQPPAARLGPLTLVHDGTAA